MREGCGVQGCHTEGTPPVGTSTQGSGVRRCGMRGCSGGEWASRGVAGGQRTCQQSLAALRASLVPGRRPPVGCRPRRRSCLAGTVGAPVVTASGGWRRAEVAIPPEVLWRRAGEVPCQRGSGDPEGAFPSAFSPVQMQTAVQQVPALCQRS